ncbi:helix-turn-helix transcriptional regulator [Candidatus Enterococcus ikei]|uniref:Helix-turn-helix transcriptional regulator n=1 Tax=Candidatus Enterococcus ikei TaxID=2815326 RepID=A0ABS3GWP6_9ENTE|nr:helix-turn-helix transcriptional regulator [Enterococcus sp. DIV0869a]MBO0439698.1 helix-turn-helix transcriptional regulator [Enterococcus sp. DIV0869a]
MFSLHYFVFFLLCYFVVVVLSAILFFKDKNKIHRILFIYFLLFFLSALSDYFNILFSEKSACSICSFFQLINVSIYVLSIIFSFLLFKQHIPTSKLWKHVLLLSLTIALIILPLHIGQTWTTSILIACLADNAFLIYLGCLTRKKLSTTNSALNQFLFQNKNFGLTLIFGGFVTIILNLYDFFYFPDVQHYFFFIHGHNLNSDGISILLCFWLIKFFMQRIHIKPVTALSFDLFENFCSEFHLTKREKDILAELLNNMTYQEIADKLYISIGTVKAHSHNIFSKTEVNRKDDLVKLYQGFISK